MADGFRRRFDIEEFVEYVRKYPCLYNKTLSEYKDINMKRTIWTAIGTHFGLSGEEAERKWKGQRDRYTKERKKCKQSVVSGAALSDIYSGNWKMYDLLHGFLGGNETQAEETIGNMMDRNVKSTSNIDVTDECVPEIEINTSNSDCFEESSKENGILYPTSQKKTKKRKDYDNDTVLNNALRTFETTTKELMKNNDMNERDKDRIDFFCVGLNVRLRKLTKKDQYEVMKDMELLMFKYEGKDEYLNM